MAKEPCVVCGEETASNSPLYSGRLSAKRQGGAQAFLCEDCSARAKPERVHELSDEDRRRFAEHAQMFGIALNPFGH
jgi:hypothetical protein